MHRIDKMPEKGPFGEQFYPYHHPMLNAAAPSNGLILGGSEIHNLQMHQQQQQARAAHVAAMQATPQFSAASAATTGTTTSHSANGQSLQMPSAFAAFHHHTPTSAAQYLWDTPPASFHHPLSHG